MKQLILITIAFLVVASCVAADNSSIGLNISTNVADNTRVLSLNAVCYTGGHLNAEQIVVVKQRIKEIETDVGTMLAGKSIDYFKDAKLASVLKEDILVSANTKITSILDIKLAVMCIDRVIVTNLLLQ